MWKLGCVLPIDWANVKFPSLKRPWLSLTLSLRSCTKASETMFCAAPVSASADVREPLTKPGRPRLILAALPSCLIEDKRPWISMTLSHCSCTKAAGMKFCAAPVSASANSFETPLKKQHVSLALSLECFGCQMIAMNIALGGRRISGHAAETTNTRKRWLPLAEVGG